jgi:hypothetical protein
MLPLGIFGAAMFAEPSVTEVEEVIGLVHGTAVTIRRRAHSLKVRHLIDTLRFYSRTVLASGPSVRRTGTATRLPLRKISTRTVSPIWRLSSKR